VTFPLNPALQAQPTGTLAPLLLVGHGTALQVLEKKGNVLVALTTPLKPALHAQPAGTLAPLLLAGQDTALQVDR